jgi:hypothetical protein
MSNKLRLNTFLKILTVIIVGYFAFDLLFGIVTGNLGMNAGTGAASDHHGASGGKTLSYSFDILINGLLILLLKLMLVLFFIVLIAGATKWIKLIWSDNSKQDQRLSKSNSIELNSLIIITASIFSLLIFFSILKGINFGGKFNNLNTSMNYSFSNYTYHRSFDVDLILGGFINVFLYIISIVLGIEVFLHLKKRYMIK